MIKIAKATRMAVFFIIFIKYSVGLRQFLKENSLYKLSEITVFLPKVSS